MISGVIDYTPHRIKLTLQISILHVEKYFLVRCRIFFQIGKDMIPILKPMKYYGFRHFSYSKI